MPKENRRSGSRGSNWQQSSDTSDDGRRSTLRETPAVVGSVNRFAPFQREVPRREPRSAKEETLTTLVPPMDSSAMSSGIIENGMRYIMFPLHLLRFCIFGTTTLSIDNEKKTIDARVTESSEKKSKERGRERKDEAKDATSGSKDKKKKEERRSDSESKKIVRNKESPRCDSRSRRDRPASKGDFEAVEKSRSIGRRSLDSRRPDEDSDSSSSDKWSTAESSMDISIESGNVYDASYRLEEPMDISIEELIDEKSSNSPRNVSHRSGTSRGRNDPSSSLSSSPSVSWGIEIEESSSSSSIEEEISRVFQRKCTSSSSNDGDVDDGTSPPSNLRVRERRNEPDRRDYDKRENVVVSRGSIHDSKVKCEKERVKPNARRKEESVRDKGVEKRATPSKTSSSREYNVTSPRRVSRTPSKTKNAKKRYKDKGIQTDSAFSDDDVEMIPLDTRLCDKRTSNRLYRHKPHSLSRQIERMDHDILYIADNEDSNDSYGRYSRNRVSSIGESSSSTDLGFEEQRYRSSSSRSPVAETERLKSLLCKNDDDDVDDKNKDKDERQKIARLPRAPPGFPEVPQNPPIAVKIWNDSFGLPFARETNPSVPQFGQSYPPAPTPMRHLYHEYPEFMPFPDEIGSNRIFQTSLANGYLF